MIFKSRSLLFAAALAAAPLGVAIAQQNNPAGNMGSNKSITASPGTADNKAASGMNTADSGHSTSPSNYNGSAMNSNAPGATGRTVVPGSNSSQAGSTSGTSEQKTGTTGGGAR